VLGKRRSWKSEMGALSDISAAGCHSASSGAMAKKQQPKKVRAGVATRSKKHGRQTLIRQRHIMAYIYVA
jgi:hypothetical protein